MIEQFPWKIVVLLAIPMMAVCSAPAGPDTTPDARQQGERQLGQGDLVETIAEPIQRDAGSAEADCGPRLGYESHCAVAEALSDLNDAIRLNPRSAGAYRRRATYYANKGDYDRAVSDLTEALRIEPQHARTRYNRGVVYGRKGENDKAIADHQGCPTRSHANRSVF